MNLGSKAENGKTKQVWHMHENFEKKKTELARYKSGVLFQINVMEDTMPISANFVGFRMGNISMSKLFGGLLILHKCLSPPPLTVSGLLVFIMYVIWLH